MTLGSDILLLQSYFEVVIAGIRITYASIYNIGNREGKMDRTHQESRYPLT